VRGIVEYHGVVTQKPSATSDLPAFAARAPARRIELLRDG
jgi:hypothetical protein